jgi:tetratricopeptide (TPR) repeat protein
MRTRTILTAAVVLDRAIACAQKAIDLDPGWAGTHNNLGVALNDQGRNKEAEQACRDAIKFKPDDAEAHNNLGNALNRQGRHKEAEQAYRHAIKLKPDYAQAHGNLGFALRNQGMFKEALKSFRTCAPLFPSGSRERQMAQQLIAETERLIELDAKLTEVLAGKAQPASPAERVELARLAQQPYRAYSAKAVSLYADAFAAQPALAAQHRYNAACAAARAGTGQGRDADRLDSNDCAHLRYAALDWLQTDLAAHADRLAGSDPKAADASRQALMHWRRDADLSAVRDREQLAKLPESEQTDWRKLWAEIDALLARHKPAR